MEPVENNDRTILTPLEIFLLALVTFGLIFAFALITSLLFGSKTAILLGEGIIVIPVIFYVWARKFPFKKLFRLNAINQPIMLYSLLLSVPIFVVSDELDRVVASFFPMPDELARAMQELVHIHSVTDAIVLFVAAVVMAGIAEEMLFRGVVQRTLEHYWEPALAIVVTAAIFAFAHLNPWMALQITFLGLIFGWIAWKSDSILPTILLHGLNNLFSLILFNMSEKSLAWYVHGDHVRPMWVILSLIIAVPLFIFLNRHFEKLKLARIEKERGDFFDV